MRNHSERLSLAPLIPSLFLVAASAAQKQCYPPRDTGFVTKAAPCFPDADDSFCCNINWVCTTAKLCIKPITDQSDFDPPYFRQSCTDPTWNSPACPGLCRSGTHANESSTGIWSCGGNEYQCDVNHEGCMSNSRSFHLDTFQNITTIGGAKGPAFATALPSSMLQSDTTTSSPASSSASPTSSSSSLLPTSLPTQTPTPAQHRLSTGAKAGIGVGVGAGVLLVALLAYLLVRQRKHTSELRQRVEGLYTQGKPEPVYKQGQLPNVEPYGQQRLVRELDSVRNPVEVG